MVTKTRWMIRSYKQSKNKTSLKSRPPWASATKIHSAPRPPFTPTMAGGAQSARGPGRLPFGLAENTRN